MVALSFDSDIVLWHVVCGLWYKVWSLGVEEYLSGGLKVKAQFVRPGTREV